MQNGVPLANSTFTQTVMPKFRKMRFLIVSLLFCLSVSCDKSAIHDVDLIGDWKLTSHTDSDKDSEIVFEFQHTGNLIIHDNEYSDTLEYKILNDNSIRIKDESINDVYDIMTYTEDLIEIMGFSISPIPEEMNTLLKRSY